MSKSEYVRETTGLWQVSDMERVTPLVIRRTDRTGLNRHSYFFVNRTFINATCVDVKFEWVDSLESATVFKDLDKLVKVMTTLTKEDGLDFYYRERGKAGYSMKPSSKSDEHIELDVCVVNRWVNRRNQRFEIQASVITV